VGPRTHFTSAEDEKDAEDIRGKQNAETTG
jgi:hypothetical protein